MIYFLRRNAGKILLFTLTAFVGGILFAGIRFGGRTPSSSRTRQAQELDQSALAAINGKPVNLFKYSQLVRRFVDQVESSGQKIDPYTMSAIEYNALKQTIEFHLTLLKAKAEKVRASGAEVNAQIDMIAQNNKISVGDLKDNLARQGIPFTMFKNSLRDEIIAGKYLREHENAISITDEDIELSLTRLRAAHILIADKEDQVAFIRANQILEQVKAGADFASLARQYSSDTYSAKQGGDLGWFAHGTMVPEFEKAAFSLNPGAVYPELVKTKFGYHIVKLLDFKRQDIPANIDAATYRKQLLERKKTQAINALLKDVRENADIQILSESHLAYQLQSEGKYEEAVIKYKKLVTENPRSYVPVLFIGDLYTRLKKYDEAMAAYKKAEIIQDLNPQMKNSIVNIARGMAYKQQGDDAEKQKQDTIKSKYFNLAGKEFARASELAGENLMVHQELKNQFEKIKWDKSAREEEKIIDRLMEMQQEEAKAAKKKAEGNG
ncbi:MAG: peptidylprolyl isomerase [Candidatus Margulisiibacteriota bacterium]